MNIETAVNGPNGTDSLPAMERSRAAYTRIPVDVCGRVKRLFNISAGFGIVAAGLAMVPLPAPDLVVILAGLRMLAKEFRWARILLDRGSELARKTKARLLSRWGRTLFLNTKKTSCLHG